MQVKEHLPVWILNTKSFWFGIAPAALTMVDIMFAAAGGDAASTPVASSLAVILGWAFGWTAEEIFGVMRIVAPIYTLIVAQQRSGITRPYAATPTAANAKPAAVLVKDIPQIAAGMVEDVVSDAILVAQK